MNENKTNIKWDNTTYVNLSINSLFIRFLFIFLFTFLGQKITKY